MGRRTARPRVWQGWHVHQRAGPASICAGTGPGWHRAGRHGQARRPARPRPRLRPLRPGRPSHAPPLRRPSAGRSPPSARALRRTGTLRRPSAPWSRRASRASAARQASHGGSGEPAGTRRASGCCHGRSGFFHGVVRAGAVSFVLGTGGRKPSGNTSRRCSPPPGAMLNDMNPAARREGRWAGDGLATKARLAAGRCGPACTRQPQVLRRRTEPVRCPQVRRGCYWPGISYAREPGKSSIKATLRTQAAVTR
jgi:hypothetical protein